MCSYVAQFGAMAYFVCLVLGMEEIFLERFGIPVWKFVVLFWCVLNTVLPAFATSVYSYVASLHWIRIAKFASGLVPTRWVLPWIYRKLAFRWRVFRASRRADPLPVETQEYSGEMKFDTQGPYWSVLLKTGEKINVRVGPQYIPSLSPHRGPEFEAQTSAVVRPVDRPVGIVCFIDKASNKVIGIGSRVAVGKQTYLLTASHVLQVLRRSCGEDLYMSTLERETKVDRKWKVIAYSPCAHLDFAILAVPEHVWASIGVKSLKMGKTPNLSSVQVYGVENGRWVTSQANAEPILSQPGRVKHYASTTSGWSGSPLVTRNSFVSAIHTGSSGAKYNLASSLEFVLGRCESDQPVWGWKPYRVEDMEDDEFDEPEFDSEGNANWSYTGRRAARRLKNQWNVSVSIGDSGFEIQSRHAGHFAKVDLDPKMGKYQPVGISWDELPDEEFDQPYLDASFEAEGFYVPGFQRATSLPGEVTPLKTSPGTAGPTEAARRKELDSSRSELSTVLEEEENPQQPPPQKLTTPSPVSPNMDGQEGEQRQRGIPSTTTAPSSRKAKRLRQRNSRRSKSGSPKTTPTQKPPKPSAPAKSL